MIQNRKGTGKIGYKRELEQVRKDTKKNGNR